ncbi:MAG: hypothetical protein WA945_03590 [Arcobacteraceae bacterium]
MGNIKLFWEEFISDISNLKVLHNMAEHTAEINISRYTKLGKDHDPLVDRYTHGINFSAPKYKNNKPVIISENSISFNIIKRIKLFEEQQDDQYKLILVKAYESFKKFIKNIFDSDTEIDPLILNYYTNIYHDSFKINLFYVMCILRVMRNKISHNECFIDENGLYSQIENLLTKRKIFIPSSAKSEIITFLKPYIDNDKSLTLKEKKLPSGGQRRTIGILIDCLLSYSHYIKERELSQKYYYLLS